MISNEGAENNVSSCLNGLTFAEPLQDKLIDPTSVTHMFKVGIGPFGLQFSCLPFLISFAVMQITKQIGVLVTGQLGKYSRVGLHEA